MLAKAASLGICSDRLTHYEDERLLVDYTYDALGRRLSKHSEAHYQERSEAGPHWNRTERVKRNRELQCGFTLYGWDGDTLAWESKIADEDGLGARTTHYVYEPGSFVPVAQAVREETIALLDQPEYGDYYRQDEDPLWSPPPPAPTIDRLAWYQADHLGTPQELTDERGDIAWAAEYRAWGVVKEAVRKASDNAQITNPIRFQGQYHDHETGLYYNLYRYYDPQVGRFVSKSPIGFAGGFNSFEYVPNPIDWIDPLGLARIKNAIEGARRENVLNAQMRAKHPNATIQCQCYLRDAQGKSMKDPVTGERRRVDTVVIENGRAQTYEVTSMTASKDHQFNKESNVINMGGGFIRDRTNGDLIPVNGTSELVILP